MRLPRSVAVLACAAVALASCSSSEPEEADVPATTAAPPVTTPAVITTTAPTTVTAPATTTTLHPEAAVLAAYEEYWAAYLTLMQEPDSRSPAINDLMTGRQREVVQQLIAQRLDQNHRLRFPANSIATRTAVVEAVSADSAVVMVCSVDDAYRLDLSTGEITNAEVQTGLLRVSVVREDDRWKVGHVLIDRTWDGVAGCAG